MDKLILIKIFADESHNFSTNKSLPGLSAISNKKDLD